MTVVLSLLGATAGQAGALAQDMLRQRFENEAVAGWRFYEEQFKLVNGRFSVTAEFSEWDSAKSAVTEIRCNRACRSVIAQEPGSGWTAAVYNSSYGFFLQKTAPDSPWVVTRLGKLMDDEELANDLRWTMRTTVDRFCNPIYLVRDPLFEAVKKPWFKILEVKAFTDDAGLVQVEFSYRHGRTDADAGNFNWVQGGTMILDPDNSWALVRADLDALDVMAERDFRISLSNEFDVEEYRGVRLPVRCVETNINPDTTYTQTRICEFTIPASPPEESAFRLAAFGIPEPVELQPRGIPWFIVGSVVAAALFAIGLVLLKRKSAQ